jgi:predicted enzyme related to lactoylglutathione lyase
MQNQQRQPVNGAFVWAELLTKDQTAAIRFYRSLFGWDINPSPNPEHGGYNMIQIQGNGIGGIMQMTAQMQTIAGNSQWVPYVGVPNIEGSAREAQSLGGEILVPPTSIDGVGRFAYLKDPTGGVFGIIQFNTPDQQSEQTMCGTTTPQTGEPSVSQTKAPII